MSELLAVAVGGAVAVPLLVVAAQAAQYRHDPGMTAFVVLFLLLALVPVPSARWWVGTVQNPLLTEDLLFTLYTFVEVTWLAFVFSYVGRGPAVTRGWLAVLFCYAVITSLGVILPPYVDGLLLGLAVAVNSVVQVTLFAAVGYATFLVVRAVLQYDDLPRGDAAVLLTAGGGLIVLTLIQVLTPEVPPSVMQGPQLAVLATMGTAVAAAQYRLDAFESGPSAGHLARETVFDDTSEAAFVTDGDRLVLDCNETAVDLFGRRRDEMLGQPLSAVLDGWDGTADGLTRLDTTGGQRQFEVTSLSLTSGRGRPIGTAFVLDDVTDRRTHEQRLDVLNRVLRHNLRNDLDAIQGFAEVLAAEGADADAEAVGTTIRERATELADIGETVGRTERLLARDDRSAVEVVGLVRGLCDRFREEYGAATLDVRATTDELVTTTDEELLRAALGEVVENALEHTDRADPHVTVTVDVDEYLRVEVRDDGPGIPDREREVLLDGEETPLRHGSGVGLWFVHWAMAELGGGLDLRENQPRGTVVSLRIPQAGSTGTRDG